MNAQSEIKTPVGLDLLRQPFPAHQISKLPKETGAQAKQRKADMDNGKWPPKCEVCGGFHHAKAVHLDYVGHAALTDRLLDADPSWSWEPVGITPEGLPAFGNGGLWIKLTVCGVTRFGFGAADGKSGGDAVKEMIGDALRNAAMRFGAALDLWHKGDLHLGDEEEEKRTPRPDPTPIASIRDDQFALIQALAPNVGKSLQDICSAYKVQSIAELTEAQATAVVARLQSAKPKENA